MGVWISFPKLFKAQIIVLCGNFSRHANMINILTSCIFILELDKERGAPIDITIQKQDINGF